MANRRDFYWKRVGWHYEVWAEIMGAHYSLGLHFWREKTAALVTNVIFGAYHDGRDVERDACAAVQKPMADQIANAAARHVLDTAPATVAVTSGDR